MKKRFLILVTILTISLLLVACGTGTNNGPDDHQQAVDDKSQSNEDFFPLTVTDGLGNEMTIPKKPENIVSLSLTSDEILLSVTDRENIEALSHVSLEKGLSNIVDEVGSIQTIQASVEVIISLHPDLVIVTNWTDQDFVKQLKDAQIPVYAYVNPNNIEEVKDLVKELALVIGEQEKGDEIVDWMDEKLNDIKEKVSLVPEDEKIKALSLDSFYYTYGKGTTFNSIAEHAGVINLAAANGMEMWQEMSKEQVVSINPDVILLPAWSYEGFDAEQFIDSFRNDPSLAEVSAIKENKVFTLPESHMTSCSQYIVLGVEDLAKTVYADYFNSEE